LCGSSIVTNITDTRAVCAYDHGNGAGAGWQCNCAVQLVDYSQQILPPCIMPLPLLLLLLLLFLW
jgi:hypothetical protein